MTKRTQNKKQNTITSSTFPNSTPRVHRSTITHSTLSNLTSSDLISRCTIDYSTISKSSGTGTQPGTQPRRVALKRSNVLKSTLLNTSLTRCEVSQSTLSNVPNARRVEVRDSTVENVSRVRRVKFLGSTVTEQSAIVRSEAKGSVVTASKISRAELDKSKVVESRIKRSNLTNCDVLNCEIVNTDFRGMVLRNGVWRNGKLVGCFHPEGEGEGVVVNGKTMAIPPNNDKTQVPENWEADFGTESSDALDTESDIEDARSEQRNEKADLPPPYTP